MSAKEIAFGIVAIAGALYTLDSLFGVRPSDLYDNINLFIERLSP